MIVCIHRFHRHKQVCQQKHKQQSTTQPSTSLQTTRQQQSSEIAVTWSDQQNINLFSRLNLKLQNLLDELKLKQSDLANTKDALNDIENLLDDDVGTCKIKIGDVYVDVTNEDAEQFANKYKYNLQLEVDNLNHKSDEIKQTMNELKNKLYKKFGNQINLEYEEGLTSS